MFAGVFTASDAQRKVVQIKMVVSGIIGGDLFMNIRLATEMLFPSSMTEEMCGQD